MNYQHAEAFNFMTYRTKSGQSITVWNSRDGVTPFITSIDGGKFTMGDKSKEAHHVMVREHKFKNLEELENAGMYPDFVWVGEPSEPRKVPFMTYFKEQHPIAAHPALEPEPVLTELVAIEKFLRETETDSVVNELLDALDNKVIATYLRNQGYTCLKRTKKRRN